jgi:hypothetical protein
MYLDRQDFIKGEPTQPVRRYPISLDIQVKRVCASYNGGWMSDSEVAAMKIIPKIYDGSKKSITQDEQAILANWAVKTAIMIRYAEKEPLVPLCRRRWLYQHQTPPPDTCIWIGRYDGKGVATIASKSLFIEGNTNLSKSPNGQSVLFSIGSLFFIVLCLYLKNVRVRVEFPSPIAEHLFKIFPAKTPNILWPDKGIDDTLKLDINSIRNWKFILQFDQLNRSP